MIFGLSPLVIPRSEILFFSPLDCGTSKEVVEHEQIITDRRRELRLEEFSGRVTDSKLF